MKSAKCIFISAAEPSVWGSCKIITPNIEAAYRGVLGRGFQKVSYNKNQTPSQIFKLAQEIKEKKTDKLVFIDHDPHPYLLLQALENAGLAKWPHLVFHVYGDFTFFIPSWIKSEDLLKGKKVTWVVASLRQKQLLQTLVRKTDAMVVCPFPVDESRFKFSLKDRRRMRLQLGHVEKDKLIFYTGRLSLQKNVVRMVQEFTKTFCKLGNPNVYIYFIGTFDNIGAPFFGIRSKASPIQEQWSEVIKQLPDSIKDKVRFLGAQDNEILNQFYCAADLFFSLSTHHDEDYGMSPVEALSCGCPALLSSWGGFAGFSFDERICDLVKISFSKGGLVMTGNEIRKKLIQKLETRISTAERQAVAKFYHERFSIAAVKPILKDLLNSEASQFHGFTATAKRFETRITRSRNPFGNRFDKGSLYSKIYKNYTEDHGTI